MKPRALSGIKPTGTPHLGNYLGMIKPALKLQETHHTFYFIADYHALTSLKANIDLKEHSLEIAACFIALGMDTNNHVFYRQSDVSQVCELTWLLSCVTSKGLLERAHAYKDALNKTKDISHGLFSYPVLMAADILLYNSNFVPVGKDQKQHLEITRDVANRFNHVYGDTFVIPEPLIEENTATIPGLDGQKMSKSYNNTIPLFSTEKKLRKAVMKIVTDSKTVEEVKDPDTCNVFQLFKFFSTAEEQQALAQKYTQGGMGYGEAKQTCFEAINAEIGPYREKYFDLIENPQKIESILAQGAINAQKVANDVLTKARKNVGLSYI